MKDILGTEIQKDFFEEESDNSVVSEGVKDTIKSVIADLTDIKNELLALAEGK